jgi:hypothetical protein
MRYYVVAAVCAALLAGCAGQKAPDGQDLTAAEFNAQVVGKMTKWESADMQYYTTAVGGYKPDGTIHSTWSSGGKTGEYNGTWKLDGNKICVTDSQANGGTSACRIFRKTGDKTYAEVNADGTLHGTTIVTQ